MNKTHTPLPTEISVEMHLTNSDCFRVAALAGARYEDQKAFALALDTRYNSHDRLVEALRVAHAYIGGIEPQDYHGDVLEVIEGQFSKLEDGWAESTIDARALLAELEAK